MQEITPRKSGSHSEALLFLLLVFSFSFFYHPSLYDNALTRLDLTYSAVFHRQISIDNYHFNTIDKSFSQGHFYCDKAPGLSFAAAPALILLSKLLPAADFDPRNPLIAYALVFLAVSIPSALAFMLFFRLARSVSGSDAAAFALTFFSAAGTICFTYSTQFYGHQFAASASIAALYCAAAPRICFGRTATNRELIAAGLLLGIAAASDYPSAVVGAVIAIYATISDRRFSAIPLFIAGAALPAAAFAAYNNAAFGNPFSIGYFKEVTPMFSEGMSKGLGGVTVPSPAAAINLLFAPQRGLFWSSPFLVFSIAGIAIGLKKGHIHRAFIFACAASFLLILAVNAAYYEPYGGFSPGPRFLVNGLPFLCLAAAAAWPRMRAYGKTAFIGLGILSVINQTIINAVDPHVPHIFAAPAVQFTIPLLRDGYSSSGIISIFGIYGPAAPIIFLAIAAALCLLAAKLLAAPAKLFKMLSAATAITIVSGAAFYFSGSALPERNRGEAAYYFASAFNGSGQRAKALAHVDRAVHLSPGLSEAWMLRGMICMKLGLMPEVERSLAMALSANPRDAQPYVSLSAFYLHFKKDPRRALATIHDGLKNIEPRNDPRISLLREIESDAQSILRRKAPGDE